MGAALLYGDGAITPAISVLSAVEGLKLVAPALDEFIVPLTLAILVGLFMIQRRGTGKIGRLFGPVMVAWFVVIGLLGAVNIYAAPAILKALSPGEAARFILANPQSDQHPARLQTNWRLPNSSDRANGPGYIRALALALAGSSPSLAGIINSTEKDCDDEFPARMRPPVAGGPVPLGPCEVRRFVCPATSLALLPRRLINVRSQD